MEQYKSKNYNIGSTTLSLVVQWKYEAGLHSKKENFVSMLCACAKGCVQETDWIEPDNMWVHVVWQAQYVEGVMHGVVGVDQVCMGGLR